MAGWTGGGGDLEANGPLESVRRCGLCRVEFVVSNLAGQVTKQAINKMRRAWGCDKEKLKEVWGVVDPPLCAGAAYDGVRVCLFCSQFFDDILHGRSAAGGGTHSVKSGEGTRGGPARSGSRLTERARKIQEYAQTDKIVGAEHQGKAGSRSELFLRRQREREQRQHDSVTRDIQASIRYQN